MYRGHGAPELLREDEAVDALCARIVRLRRRLRVTVIVGSLVVAFASLGAVATLEFWSLQLTGRVLGIAFGAALLGALFGGNEIAMRITARFAERWARELADEKRCDAEPLVDAARLLSGGVR